MVLGFLNCYNYVVMNCTSVPAASSVTGGNSVSSIIISPTFPDNKKRNMTIIGVLTLVIVIVLLVFVFIRNKNSPKENEVSIK